jgi:hypothetical protein
MNILRTLRKLPKTKLLYGLSLLLAVAAGPAMAVYASGGGNHGQQDTKTFVTGTFRTPTGGAADCPGVPVGTDCQIDKFFYGIGGPDNGTNPGADDKLTTVFIHEDQPAVGYWTYKDKEEITGTHGVFRGYEQGVIDARPGLPTTGSFGATYHGVTDDHCYELDFGIGGIIDISGIVDQSSNPVNDDNGTWAGYITKKC